MTRYDEFRKNGFVVIKNALTIDQIKKLRQESRTLFENKHEENKDGLTNTAEDRKLYANTFIDNPLLLNSLFTKSIVDQIKEVLGEDYITFIQYSLGNNLHSPVWHADSQSQGFSTQYVYNSECNIAKCGLYFQEDDSTYGGQLDIIPGSHLPTFLGTKSPITSEKRYGKVSVLQLLAMNIRNRFLKKVSVNLPAGDILLFHGLLLHRASQPNWNKVKKTHSFGIKNPPEDKEKFMVQWEVSVNNEFARIYATHQQRRGSVGKNEHFAEADKFTLDDFHESTRKIINENSCNVKSYRDLAMSIETNNLKSKDGTPIVFYGKVVN